MTGLAVMVNSTDTNRRKLLPRDPSPTRVLVNHELSDRLTQISVIPSWPAAWRIQMLQSLSTWQTWELPAHQDHRFWTELEVPDDLLKLRVSDAGWAPYLLALCSLLPRSGDLCKLASQQIHCFLLWDDWLKRHGGEEDFAQLAVFFGDVTSEFGVGEGGDKFCTLGRRNWSTFSKRLDDKYPLKKEMFLRSLAASFSTEKGSSSTIQILNSKSWLFRYLAGWNTYCTVGLPAHSVLKESLALGETPSLHEYLLYRSATSVVTPAILLAAAHHDIPEVNDDCFQKLLPLIFTASALTAVYSDSVLLAKGRLDASASLSAAYLFDNEMNRLLQNSLAVAFAGVAARLEQEAQEALDDSERMAVLALVRVTKSVVHGNVAWVRSAWRFREASSAPTPSKAKVDHHHGSQQLLEGMEDLSTTVPQWLMDEIETAAADFSELH